MTGNIAKGIEFLKGLGNFALVAIGLLLLVMVFQFVGNWQSKSTNSELRELVKANETTIKDLRDLNQAFETNTIRMEDSLLVSRERNIKAKQENKQLKQDYQNMIRSYELFIKQKEKEHELQRRKLLQEKAKIIFENFEL